MMSEIIVQKRIRKKQNVHIFLDSECGAKVVKMQCFFFLYKKFIGANLQGESPVRIPCT